MPTPIQILRSYEVCGEGLRYAEDFDTPDQAWLALTRGDWALYAIGGFTGAEPRTEKRERAARVMIEVARLSIASSANAVLAAQFLDLLQRLLDDEAGVTEEQVKVLLGEVDAAEGDSGLSVAWSAGWYAWTSEDQVAIRDDALFLGQTYASMGGTLDVDDEEWNVRNANLAVLVRTLHSEIPTTELNPTGPICAES